MFEIVLIDEHRKRFAVQHPHECSHHPSKGINVESKKHRVRRHLKRPSTPSRRSSWVVIGVQAVATSCASRYCWLCPCRIGTMLPELAPSVLPSFPAFRSQALAV